MINIILKDLKLIFSDRKALAIVLLMPIILTTILGFALANNFTTAGSSFIANIAVVKEYEKNIESERADEEVSRILSQYASGEINLDTDLLDPENILFKDFLDLEEVAKAINYQIVDMENANQLLSDKKVSAIVIIPENFIFDMYINFLTPFRNNISIKVVSHPDMPYTGRIIEGFFQSFSDIISASIISKNILLEEASRFDLTDSTFDLVNNLDFSTLVNSQITITDYTIEGKNPISSFMYYTAAMLSMFIFFSAGYAGKYMLHEHEYQTSMRLMSTNVKFSQIILSKFIMTTLLVITQSTVMILFSRFAFSVNWVSMPQVFVTILISALAVAAIGLLIIALTLKHNSYKVYDAFTSFIIQVFALLGGNFIPIEVMPGFIQTLSEYIPNGSILRIYVRILEGSNFSELIPLYLNLVLVSAVFIVSGTFMLRKEGRQNA
jgi:ABC-2 type transport system permease protein